MAYQTGGKPVVQAGKTNKTPAPEKKTTESRFGTVADGYGTNNGGNNPSSVNPGVSKTSGLADELKSAGTDGVLDIVIAKGVAKADSLAAFGDVQQREVSPKPYPTAHGMRNRNVDANAKIPGALVGGQAEPVRKPE
jgi:hypothetical protein